MNTIILTITNVFEYGTTTYDYEACVDLNDGRGYTCGFVGFTTGTGDAFTVVDRYLKVNPYSELKAYYDPLKELADPRECGGPEVDPNRLNGFPNAWSHAACTDSKFRRVQELVVNDVYFEPAMKLAESYKIYSPLGKAIVYDTAVQHGYEKEDGISLRSIVKLVKAESSKPMNEKAFLRRLLHFRRKILCCSMDNIWPDSANRVSDLQFLLDSGNLQLNTPVVLPSYDDLKIYGNEQTDKPCRAASPLKPLMATTKEKKPLDTIRGERSLTDALQDNTDPGGLGSAILGLFG
ncbi:lysozyme-like protein [Basidiobolus meristosporus CBS 931.73]|uniref:Lysozyme-like protein n=1 Tax=Basidiobolus meristosporus CBS 931.73 TaxID=1314790 RepID=A0A1Y1XA55_9FUNG|nr:lysozyme-like protein [Basidiobolus meristosporus CBS 931.73]|eukprot:ORX82625.1 lysozyme-like protein [Basidiobolus meristosporus CBS 931.73]